MQIITCEAPALNGEVVKGVCEIVLETLGTKPDSVEFTILPFDKNKTVPEIIRTYIVEQSSYIDFIFCGNNGADFSSKDHNKYLGSVANEILRNTKINLFFMVNPPIPSWT